MGLPSAPGRDVAPQRCGELAKNTIKAIVKQAENRRKNSEKPLKFGIFDLMEDSKGALALLEELRSAVLGLSTLSRASKRHLKLPSSPACVPPRVQHVPARQTSPDSGARKEREKMEKRNYQRGLACDSTSSHLADSSRGRFLHLLTPALLPDKNRNLWHAVEPATVAPAATLAPAGTLEPLAWPVARGFLPGDSLQSSGSLAGHCGTRAGRRSSLPGG